VPTVCSKLDEASLVSYSSFSALALRPWNEFALAQTPRRKPE
jgi:hypothetical protein